ncbi:MAG: hypothetical protein NTY63_07595 [Candidatus Bipolaricaulota bacterium]|nr:hypothetical protein [Candidatus Bipolaricaulota bacterium]
MNSRGLVVLFVLVLSAPLSCAAQLPSEAQPAARLSCDLGFLQAMYPDGTAISTSFRGLLSLAVGEELYPGYARLLVADFEATISGLPVFVDLNGDGLAERLLLDAVSLTATDIRWTHGGIRLATGDFLLYVHILVSDLRVQGATVLGPQYVRPRPSRDSRTRSDVPVHRRDWHDSRGHPGGNDARSPRPLFPGIAEAQQPSTQKGTSRRRVYCLGCPFGYLFQGPQLHATPRTKSVPRCRGQHTGDPATWRAGRAMPLSPSCRD